MPIRISVPPAPPAEESRQLAESVAEMHYVIGTIVEGAKELVPGESVDELTAAWAGATDSFRNLVTDLTGPADQSAIPHKSLVDAQLTGDVGKLKRSTLARLKDRFFRFWNSEPRTDEKRLGAADAACDYLELCETVVSSIPGWEKIEELVALVRQLLQVRKKRGS